VTEARLTICLERGDGKRKEGKWKVDHFYYFVVQGKRKVDEVE